MAQSDQVSGDPEEENKKIWRGFGKFIDRVEPWLLEIGIWIFGSLLAFNLLVLASLFTVGPVDTAIKVSTAAFALDLPVNICGLLLLRMVREFKDARIENELTQAFLDEGFNGNGQIPAPEVIEAMRQRRSGIALRYSAGMLAASVVLTLTGLVATLWHMSWWIAVGFCLMVVASLIVTILAFAGSQTPETNQEEQLKEDEKKEVTNSVKEPNQ